MFLDGAMGTMVQRLKLQESDFRGIKKKVIEKDTDNSYDVFRPRVLDLVKGFKRQ